ncbi:MAG: hypothetical protein ACYSR7_01810 [Planctomycetota bacterium]
MDLTLDREKCWELQYFENMLMTRNINTVTAQLDTIQSSIDKLMSKIPDSAHIMAKELKAGLCECQNMLRDLNCRPRVSHRVDIDIFLDYLLAK